MTLDQKFILLIIENDSFKEDCDSIVKKWGFLHPKKRQYFNYNEETMPGEYKVDLKFILNQFHLPRRLFLPLHEYLRTGKVPEISELPPHVRINTKSDTAIIEIDHDATEKDIEFALTSIADMRKFLKKLNNFPKKTEPIRNFVELLKIIKNNKNDGMISDKSTNWAQENSKIRKDILNKKGSLKTKRSRYKKLLKIEKRIPVDRREEYEESLKKVDPRF